MKYGFTLSAADAAVANSPELGGESRLSMSYEDFGVIGEITQAAPNSGTFAAQVPAFSYESTGNDLALLCKTAVRSSVPVVITFGVTFGDNTTGTATATFSIPSYSQNQSYNLPAGLAVDVNGVGGGAAKTIKIINSMTVVGGAANNVFQLVSLPSTWYPIGCAKKKDMTPNVPKAVPIACGLNASAFTKYGLSDPGQLDLEALHFTYADGLTRFQGDRASAKVDVYKDGRVLSERVIMGGFRAAVKNPKGDGNDEARDTTTGFFEIFAVFV
jgi:hypothetical protein